MLRRGIRRLQHYEGGHPPSGYGYAQQAGGGYPQMDAAPSSRRYSAFEANSFRARHKYNTGLNIVPQGEMWVVERLGRYYRTLTPGVHFLVPGIDKIPYMHSSKEQGIQIPHQSAITRDNVMLEIDGVLFLRVVDAERASYNIDNPIFNLINIAQTTMRSEIGKLTLDTLFEERDKLNGNIVESIKSMAQDWGVECKRYEIRDISVSDIVRKSMDLQAEAERKKRKVILESEGDRDAVVNKAHGDRIAAQEAALGVKYAKEVTSLGDLEAAMNRLKGLEATSSALAGVMSTHAKSTEAFQFMLASDYLTQLGKLAKETNSIVLAAPLGDPAAVVTQAMAIAKNLK